MKAHKALDVLCRASERRWPEQPDGIQGLHGPRGAVKCIAMAAFLPQPYGAQASACFPRNWRRDAQTQKDIQYSHGSGARLSSLPFATLCNIGPAAMDAIRVALGESVQSLTTAGAQMQQSSDAQLRADIADICDKLSRAMQGLTLFINTEQDRMKSYVAGAGQTTRSKSVMDHKIVQNLSNVNGDKTKFRQWNHKFRSALMTVDKVYDNILEVVEKELNIGTSTDDIDNKVKVMITSADYNKLTCDLYCILVDKAENEAYDKIKNIGTNKGLQAYMVLYRWFTDVSGLGLAEQARRLMQPVPPKDEGGLAESIEAWRDKMARLEAHGDDYKMAPVFKINALKSLMVGRGKDLFEVWETAENAAHDEDFFQEVLAKAEDYARKKKLDNSAKQNMQKGSDSMDIGYTGYDFDDEQHIHAVGGKGKGCWTCGSPEHIARLCPKGKGKAGLKGWRHTKGAGKTGPKEGLQGACHYCGEYGHWVRECPYSSKGGRTGEGKHGRWKSMPGDDYYSEQGYGGGKGKGKGKGKYVSEFEECEGDAIVDMGNGEIDQTCEEDDEVEWVQVVKKRRGINIIDKKALEQQNEISEISCDGQWEKIRVQVDSGAFDWVTPRHTATHIPIIETEASKNGMHYSAANGSDIKAYGEKEVTGLFDEGFGMRAKMQVADVKRTLASVMSMNRTGNRVVLDGQNSFVENKKTGKRVQIHVEGNQYVFYIWVKAGYQPKGATQIGEVHKRWVPKTKSQGTPTRNRYAVLAADDGDNESVFSRQDKE